MFALFLESGKLEICHGDSPNNQVLREVTYFLLLHIQNLIFSIPLWTSGPWHPSDALRMSS